MPSTRSRARTAQRRSPRAAGRPAAPAGRERPLVVPFAVAFGLLMAVEALYLGYLLWEPAPAFDWYLVVPVVVAVVAVTASLLVLCGPVARLDAAGRRGRRPAGGAAGPRVHPRRPRRDGGGVVGGAADDRAAGLPDPRHPPTGARVDHGPPGDSLARGTARPGRRALASRP